MRVVERATFSFRSGLWLLVLTAALGFSLACESLPLLGVDEEPQPRVRLRAIDGLEQVPFSAPGILELREDHRIGSYDALLIPEVAISYERGSLQLTPPAERAFLTRLRETLVDATRAARIPVEEVAGRCVMEVRLRVSRMDLRVGDRADQLAAMTIVMQFIDSSSGAPLLRYATDTLVPNPVEGETPDARIREGLRDVIADLNITAAFRESGFADQPIMPGCEGTLAAVGTAARDRR